MKFFERTYLLTLAVFLVFLNISVAIMCIFTFDSSMKATEESCIAESHAILSSYEKDSVNLNSDSNVLLQVSYCNFYGERDIYLHFAEGGIESFSSMPAGVTIPESGELISVRAKGQRYIVISMADEGGRYTVTYAKDITYLYDDFKGIAIAFVVASLVASVALAIVLYFVLSKIYSPLARLREATRDISEGSFLTRADERGNDELSALASDFNRMADKISAQMEELRSVAEQRQRMLDDLAHEMRTPLTVIHGYAEYIAGARVSEEEKTDALEYIMKETMRLKGVSEVLLDTAFIRENKITPVEISVRELLSGTAERYRLICKERKIEMLVCCDTDYKIMGDRALMELFISNLTDNAIKACSDGGGIIELGAMERDLGLMLYVKDNGVGMTKEQLAHVREPFYRADKSRSRKNGGAGLGLSLCDTIAKAHHGVLDFESAEGEGTTAYIRLENSYKAITIQ